MTGRTGSQGTVSDPNQPAGAAESVPGYRDLTRIGHGGFSVVYRAVQESFERAVALKVLSVGPDEDARRRFLREVRLASRLSGHPHVVTVLDTGTTDSGRPYLAMDLYDGGSMKRRLNRSGTLSGPETAMLGAKIAEALAAAHSLGILHRDVKPNNILISRFGEPALADFGVSCLLDSSSSASVLDVFSPQHAAPELMTRGVPSVSSDVYALGSTMFELLTGQPPFAGDSRDVRSIMWRTLSEPAPRPDCPELPELADAIVRAMAKEPEERFPDAASFAETLRALIPEGAPTALTLPLADRSAAGAAGSAAAPTAVRGLGAAAGAGAGAEADADPDSVSAAAFEAEVEPESLVEQGFEPDATTGRHRLSLPDETMVRPDRVDPEPGQGPAGRGGGATDEPREGSRRARKPLIVLAALILLGGVGWAIWASQGPSTTARDDASARHAASTASAHASAAHSSARPKPSLTPSSTTHSSAPVEARSSAPAEKASSAKPTASSTGSSGSLLSLPGAYYRFQNAQSGDCLTDSGSSAGQSSCASAQSEGWEYSEALTGLLTAPVSGEFELVNQQSGNCLTANGGGVGAQSCDGDSAQLWSKGSGSGSSGELRNAGDGQCLLGSGSAVAVGSCSTSDQADLWTQDGTG